MNKHYPKEGCGCMACEGTRSDAKLDEAIASAELAKPCNHIFEKTNDPYIEECKFCKIGKAWLEKQTNIKQNYSTIDHKLRYFRSSWGYHLPDDARNYLNDIIGMTDQNEIEFLNILGSIPTEFRERESDEYELGCKDTIKRIKEKL